MPPKIITVCTTLSYPCPPLEVGGKSVVLDESSTISLPHSLLFAWAVRHLRGWGSISSGQLPDSIPVQSTANPHKRIAALCLDTKKHVQQVVTSIGATHQLVAVTPRSLAGWIAAAAPDVLSLRMLPYDDAVPADPRPSLTHFLRRTTFRLRLAINLALLCNCRAFRRGTRELVSHY